MNNRSSDEYNTPRAASASSWAPGICRHGEEAVEPVGPVMLLGTRVTAYVIINADEHRRRATSGTAAVTDPVLLDRLIDLPVAIPVLDPVIWAEMADQPPGIVERGDDAMSVTRRLEHPLTIEDVMVEAPAGRELRAVQDASLFAGFARRWVAAARGRVPESTILEAKLCGVGIVDSCRRVILPAEKPVALTVDEWSWLLREKAYRRWLSQQSRERAMGNSSLATDGSSAAVAD